MNSVPASPPPPPSSSGSSFYHRAATYAVMAPLVGVLLNVVFTIVVRATGDVAPQVRLILGFLPGLVMLSGFPAAIIALCGIPAYGKRSLLWKGLVGLLIPVLLFALAIPAFMKVRQRSLERARQQQQTP